MATTESIEKAAASKPPSVITRAAQAVAYTIAGVRPDTWFGPNQPLAPMAPADVKGRAYDYIFGYNLQYTPRATEAVKFAQLKYASKRCDLLRLLIETRKDRMAVLDWEIRPREQEPGKRPAKGQFKAQIDEVKALLASPDRRLDWGQWLKEVMDQNLILDAVSIYRRKTRAGKPYAWEIIDGATIHPLFDADGRTPPPPSPAYQQVIKGIPAANYSTWTTGDMLYYPENPTVDSPYGLSRVEQALRYINLQIARLDSQLGWYEEGNVPEGFIEAPKEMTLDQVRTMQDLWDSIFAGLDAIKKRRKIWWLPQGSKYTAMKEAALKAEIDEWIARILAFSLSEDPTPFIRQQNRATAESAQLKAESEGLLPSMIFVSRLVNKLIALDFPDYADKIEFAWSLDTEFDPVKKMMVDTGYVKTGIKSIDEVRESIGEESLGGEFANPMALTVNGYVMIKAVDPTQPKPVSVPLGPDGKPIPPALGKPKPGTPAAAGKDADDPAGQTGATGSGTSTAAGSKAKAKKDTTEKRGDGPVDRPVLNGYEMAKWLAGLPVDGSKLAASDLRVEVGIGSPGLDEPSALLIDGGPREVGNLLDGRLALFFESPEIDVRSAGMAEPGWNPRPAIPLTSGPATLLRAAVPAVGKDEAVRKARDAVAEADARALRAPEGSDKEAAVAAAEGARAALASAEAGGTTDTAPAEERPWAGQLLLGAEEWGTGDGIAAYPYKPTSSATGESGEVPDPFEKVSRDEIDAAAAEADRDPSRAEIAAGNYRHGHFRHGGVDFSVENAAGSVRRGVGPDGEPWSVRMPAHYGYARLSEGADGDHVDVYFGPDPGSERVWVLDQIDAETGEFDEHKAFLFFDSWGGAQAAYVGAFSDGRAHERMGHVSSMSFDEFKAWLAEGPKTRPQSMPIRKAKDLALRLHTIHAEKREACETDCPYCAGYPISKGSPDQPREQGRYAGLAAEANSASARASAAVAHANSTGAKEDHATAARVSGMAAVAHQKAGAAARAERATPLANHAETAASHDRVAAVHDKLAGAEKTVTVSTGLVAHDLRGARRPDAPAEHVHELHGKSLFRRPKFEKIVRVWRGY